MGFGSLVGMGAGAFFGGPTGAAIGGALGGMLDGSEGGTQSANTSQTRTPWAPAAPWLTENVKRGQELQNFYQSNPFSPAQQQAYGNQFALSNGYRAMLPQLMQGMNQTPFDRTNPLSRPQPMNFTPPSGSMNFSPVVNPFSQMAPAAAPAAPAAPAASLSGMSAGDMATLRQMLQEQQMADSWRNRGS